MTNPWEPDPALDSIREQIPRQPIGSRMVLFVQRGSSAKDRVQWKPAHAFGPMKWSVVWIEDGRLFWFGSLSNPGTSLLVNWDPSTSETDLKEQIQHVIQVQQEVQDELETEPGAQRAQMLEPFLESDVGMARITVLEELEKSGESAIPALETMLDDPTYDSEAPWLISILAKVGAESAAPFLNTHFERQVAFWESKGSSVPEDWLANGRYDNPLGRHFEATEALIEALKMTRCKGALEPAMRLHQLWTVLPQMNNSTGSRALGEASEQLIIALEQQ